MTMEVDRWAFFCLVLKLHINTYEYLLHLEWVTNGPENLQQTAKKYKDYSTYQNILLLEIQNESYPGSTASFCWRFSLFWLGRAASVVRVSVAECLRDFGFEMSFKLGLHCQSTKLVRLVSLFSETRCSSTTFYEPTENGKHLLRNERIKLLSHVTRLLLIRVISRWIQFYRVPTSYEAFDAF